MNPGEVKATHMILEDKKPSSDQWLSDGICAECRRKKYCTKGCIPNRIARRRLFDEKFLKTELGKILVKMQAVEKKGEISVDE